MNSFHIDKNFSTGGHFFDKIFYFQDILLHCSWFLPLCLDG